MPTEVVIEAEAWCEAGLDALARRAVAATLGHLGLDPKGHEVAVLGCDDARMTELNTDFRARSGPTNVLSWPSVERRADRPGAPPPPPQEAHLGDIAIAYGTTSAEARAAGRSLADHATHLLVHACLHLLGYDHETEADATLMEATETDVLAGLAIADPYLG